MRVEAESRKDLEEQSSTLKVEATNAAAQQKEEYKDALTALRREVATHQQQLKEKAMPGDELTVAFEGKVQEVADLTEQLTLAASWSTCQPNENPKKRLLN